MIGISESIKQANTEVQRGFVRKVYGILSVQLLSTVVIAAPFQQLPMEWFANHMWVMQASLVVSIVAIVAISCCPHVGRTYPTNYLLLGAFTVSEAVLVGLVSARYTAGSVCLCAGLTAIIFLGMTVLAWTTKIDFTGYGTYGLAGLLALFTLGCAFSIMMCCGIHIPMMGAIYAFFGVVLFTLYIVYDTQLIMGGGHKVSFSTDDYVFAALNLYLDIINIFLELLSLFGDKK